MASPRASIGIEHCGQLRLFGFFERFDGLGVDRKAGPDELGLREHRQHGTKHLVHHAGHHFAVEAVGHHLADHRLRKRQTGVLLLGQRFGLKQTGHHARKPVEIPGDIALSLCSGSSCCSRRHSADQCRRRHRIYDPFS